MWITETNTEDGKEKKEESVSGEDQGEFGKNIEWCFFFLFSALSANLEPHQNCQCILFLFPANFHKMFIVSSCK